ncbi:hypothetical protein CQY20_29285 [Mycolicibacterium agri]|uniref:FAD-dependent pyridine nucleotide-disulfide oxidoreductase n=1 Tax=Mycolicibacterium agri TaxID=36811 RepID=A0A2A7MRF9_MYCAG|nr:hypothetical protein [Mycolicibacterium agri]PEG33718.1 hypothetical protein CQY20_29285 [Mycolicibacterium agri]GFG55830.1 hypothetical protein MAGR_72710 [Mycolicibacterium agri]
MAIAAADVRRLLDDERGDAVLVFIEGRAEVISQAEADDEDYRGALQVVSREDLIKRLGGDEPSDRELDEQAAILDSTVSELGG